MPILKLGPEIPSHSDDRSSYVKLAFDQTRTTIGQDFILGRECHSLEEIEELIAQLESDLEDVRREAQMRYQERF